MPRKEAKALDAGARVEDQLERKLNSRKVDVESWRLPGIRRPRLNGKRYHPDAAAYLPELEGLVPEVTPQIQGRPSFNVVIEVKSQKTPGSTDQKIAETIRDLAHMSDETGAVTALLLHTTVFTDTQIEYLMNEGDKHSVVVLTDDANLTHERFVGECLRVAKERRRLLRRIGPRGGYTPSARPNFAERGLADRVTTRMMNGKVLRKYGADPRWR